MARPRAIAYIDGFNFYYGSIKGGPHKWLDLERLFRLLRADDELVRIRYFTALVDGEHGEHQRTYLRAIATLPLVEIVLGKLRAACDRHRTFPQELLGRAQLPSRVPDGAGGWIVKPSDW